MRLHVSFAVAAFLVSAASAAPVAQDMTVVNGTHFAVLAIKVKGANGAWQPDILKGNTLGIGQVRKVALPSGTPCKVDLVAILNDGHKVLIAGKNACSNAAVAITDNRK